MIFYNSSFANCLHLEIIDCGYFIIIESFKIGFSFPLIVSCQYSFQRIQLC